jgi:hypothetical protein
MTPATPHHRRQCRLVTPGTALTALLRRHLHELRQHAAERPQCRCTADKIAAAEHLLTGGRRHEK